MTAHFLDAQSATAYRDACNAADGLPRAGSPPAEFPYGWTLTWADVVERDGVWPVPNFTQTINVANLWAGLVSTMMLFDSDMAAADLFDLETALAECFPPT